VFGLWLADNDEPHPQAAVVYRADLPTRVGAGPSRFTERCRVLVHTSTLVQIAVRDISDATDTCGECSGRRATRAP
jgi:hypothetical protein